MWSYTLLYTKNIDCVMDHIDGMINNDCNNNYLMMMAIKCMYFQLQFIYIGLPFHLHTTEATQEER